MKQTKRWTLALTVAMGLAGGALTTTPAQAADVGVSINISQPGVFGRIDIGRFPQPQVIVQQPVIIARQAHQVLEPVYLWVPPGHQKNWRKHCRQYNACGVPVYFVQERWYHDHVMRAAPPAFEPRPGRDGGHGRHGGPDRGYEGGRDQDGERGGDHGGEKGHGRGHGRAD